MGEKQTNETATLGNQKTLFRESSFLLLWIGTLFSGLGISMFMFAEAWYVVQKLNLEASLGVVYIFATVPRVLLMMVGGVLSDKISQPKIMFVSDLTKALLISGLAILLFFSGAVDLWVIILLAFFAGILDAFFWPASSSIIPAIVTPSSITRANSIIQTTNQLGTIAGPMIAGAVITTAGFIGVFSSISVLLLAGGTVVCFIKIPPFIQDEGESNLLSSLKKGISYVKHESILRGFVLKTLFLNLFFIGPLTVGLPIFVKTILKGEAIDYSFAEAFLAGGMVFGSLLLGLMNLKRNRGMISLSGQLLVAFSFWH